MTAAIVQTKTSGQGWPSGGNPSTGHENDAVTVHAPHNWAKRFAANPAPEQACCGHRTWSMPGRLSQEDEPRGLGLSNGTWALR